VSGLTYGLPALNRGRLMIRRILNVNHSRAVTRALTSNHSRVVSRALAANHSRALATAGRG